jgi:hypothetical protein
MSCAGGVAQEIHPDPLCNWSVMELKRVACSASRIGMPPKSALLILVCLSHIVALAELFVSQEISRQL